MDMSRVVIIGVSGAGKTTLANQLAERINALSGQPCQRIEMDALAWLPNWEQVERETLRQKVAERVRDKQWVLDGNYSSVRDLTWPAADTVIWLNYSFSLVLWRVFWRTIKRTFRRELLWGTNRESLSKAFLSKDSIIWWTISTYHRRQRTYPELLEAHGPDRVFIFTHPKQVEGLLLALDAEGEARRRVMDRVSDESGRDGGL